jgi:peroxiredoxin Q/BCP
MSGAKNKNGRAAPARRSAHSKSLASKAASRAPPPRQRAARSTPRHAGSAAAAPPAAAPHPALAVGDVVPDFALPSTGGGQWQLSQARGRKLVVYFYPRDNTPGCTLEGQQFAALAPRFERAGVAIVGISRDSLAAHERFRSQMGFPFPLLSDADSLACRLFDVIREKNMYGRKVMGVERSTFLLDERGVLRHEWRKLKVDGHALAVLNAAQAL